MAGRRLRGLTRTGQGESGLARALARVHITVSGGVLLALAVLGWIAARWIGSRTMYLLVYGGLLAMGVSWFVARRKLALDVDRSALPTRMREGQVTEVNLRIVASKRVSTVMIHDTLPEALGRTVRLPVASLAAGEDLEHRYLFSPIRRGVYEVGPAVATWSDPFGLTTQQQQLTGPETVIVHPSTELVHDRILARMWEDPPMRPPVSKPWPTGFEFYGMRDYVQGDDLRRVVWSAVAKTGRMLVRESEQGITDRVSMFLDTNHEFHSPGDPSDTFELGVRVAASIGERHLRDGFSVSLSSCEGRLGENLRGPRARITLLDHLARVQATRASLSDAGHVLLADARRGSHFVVVTPHVDKDVTNRLRLVLERGASVVVVKLVWEESDPQSLARAASLGCQVVQVPLHASIEAAFVHQVGGGMRG